MNKAVVIENPSQPCPYGNTVRDGSGQHVPCGVKLNWQDGGSPDFLYCGQCQQDFAAMDEWDERSEGEDR